VNGEAAFLKYGITAAAAGLITWLVADLHGLGFAADSAVKYRVLADAFTIPGITLIMLWLLALVSMEGIFDGISYALIYTASTLFPGMGGRKNEAYADYVERKAANRGTRKGIAFLWHVGAAYMIPAIVFTVLFYTA
jgi:hypothetical protein